MGILKRIAAFGITRCRLRCTLRWFIASTLFVLNCAVLLLNVLFYAANNVVIPSSNEVHLMPPLDSSIDVHFMPPLDSYDRALLDLTFKAFTEAMDSNNVTYFVFSGTLLGSWRHHGLIPWDDDIDVMINASDRQAVSRVLRSKVAEDPASFGLYEWETSDDGYIYQGKFYPRNGKGLYNKSFNSPNVDIFFYRENETHIWNASPFFTDEVWLKSRVFPLRRRPFGNLMVPAPCNPEAFLGVNFNLSVCESRKFDHRPIIGTHMSSEPIQVPCSRLAHFYPFVHRPNTSGKFVQETLIFRNSTLGRFKAATCY